MYTLIDDASEEFLIQLKGRVVAFNQTHFELYTLFFGFAANRCNKYVFLLKSQP